MTLKNLIPIKIKYIIKAIPSYIYDFHRFYKYSGQFALKNKKPLESKIIHDYHIIEKGLTMPETRLGFGKEKLLILIQNCKYYIKEFGYSSNQIKHAVKVINEYRDFHKKENYELDPNVLNSIHDLNQISNDNETTSQINTTANDYFSKANANFFEFAPTRKSIRNFSDKELDVNRIVDSVNTARNAPSACNRQTAKTYIITEKHEIENILKLQGGNRGFGHLTNKLIIVVADLNVFFDLNERYQAYIDGGLFAMSLLYALHANRIVACILNCSHTSKKDIAMRKICPIKDNEVFIAMIACGEAPDNFKVAISCRNPVEEYINIS
ncbi:MAG: nitroreductase family protein [Flavobacteriaceae bacterium]|nr:nitroreductase family protein [Flavobacteriaceae bacterium]